MSDHQDCFETSAAVDSILEKAMSIFDPLDAPSTSSSQPLPTPSPLQFGPSSGESSDEETRAFLLKYDPFVPTKPSSSATPSIKLRKTPRIKNAPKCTYKYKRGQKKGELCDVFCKLGEPFCGKHKPAEKKQPDFDLETFALKVKLRRLKVSKKYKLIHFKEQNIFLEDSKRILKVRLPEYLKPIPKTGSYLIFKLTGKDKLAKKTWAWECI
jgi:hypothetical protein